MDNKIKNTNGKFEKISDDKAQNVWGGYIGKDWSPKYANAYHAVGISHEGNLIGYDEYRIDKTLIPKSFAYKVAESYMSNSKTDSDKATLDLFKFIKTELEGGRVPEVLDDMWREENC